MNIFAGLESLGFDGLGDMELYKKEKKENKRAKGGVFSAEDPMQYIYVKEYVCSVCDHTFMNPAVRKTKLRLLEVDTDLKRNYLTLDPTHYDVLICDRCGYAAMWTYFNRVSDKQIDLILQKIKPNYTPKTYDVPYTLKDAVERYKLALLCAVTKGSKASEKAMLCLKIAWIYRDMGDGANELLFLRNAFIGLKEAYEAESFPIASMDENTMQYMIGELARRVGEPKEAMRWISALVVRKNVPKNIKERAMNIKDMIRTEIGK